MKKTVFTIACLFAMSFCIAGDVPNDPQLASEQTPYGDAYIKRLPIAESIAGVPIQTIVSGGTSGAVNSVSIYPGLSNGTIQYSINSAQPIVVTIPGLGSAAFTNTTDYATAVQGDKADKSAPSTELYKYTLISDFAAHTGNGVIHVTQTDRDRWDSGGGGGVAGVSSWNGQTGAVTFAESDPSFSEALPNLMTKDATDQTISGTVTFDGKLYASSIQTDNMLVTDYVEIANSLATDGNINMTGSGRITNLIDPMNDQDASTKKYVDSSFSDALQAVIDLQNMSDENYAVKPDSRAGYVMPPKVFDYVDSNTFTLDASPKFIIEGMILSATSFTYLQEDDWEFSGTQFTVKNMTLSTGDKVKVTYAIQ